MSEIVAYARAHLSNNFMNGRFAQCRFVCNQRYRNTMYKLEKCDYHFFLHSNWLSPMCMLSLYKRSEVMYQPVKSSPSHSQYVIEHIRGVDIENIFFKPTCGSRFDVPFSIHNTFVLSNKVQNLLLVWVLQCILLGLMHIQCF